MDEVSKEGFVPRHLRGVDMDEYIHRRTKCQFHAIASDRLRDWSSWDYDDDYNRIPARCDKPTDPRTGLRLCAEHTDRIGTLNPRLFTLRNARKQLYWEDSETVHWLREEATRMRKIITFQAKRLRGDPVEYGPERPPAPSYGTVYALLSGYNVKVGWTSRRLQDRLREYPPSTQILVHFAGTRSDETQVKKKFAHLATHGKEWFPYAPQVVEWVEAMKAEHGDPDATIVCGPAKTYVPRFMQDKPTIKPKYWTGKIA